MKGHSKKVWKLHFSEGEGERKKGNFLGKESGSRNIHVHFFFSNANFVVKRQMKTEWSVGTTFGPEMRSRGGIFNLFSLFRADRKKSLFTCTFGRGNDRARSFAG